MLNCEQLRKLIIQPVLNAIDLYSQEAEDLLIGTCAQESKGGTYIFQVSINYPQDLIATIKKDVLAIGIYQMEPNTHDDIWKNFLTPHIKQKPNKVAAIVEKMKVFCTIPETPTATIMLYNLYYATAMARLHYYRVSEPIPTDLEKQAEYYKKYYNTEEGSATVEEYLLNYCHYRGIKK